jgi:hypothetical protein
VDPSVLSGLSFMGVKLAAIVGHHLDSAQADEMLHVEINTLSPIFKEVLRLKVVVAPGRVELPTFGLGNRCSIHLSYGAMT